MHNETSTKYSSNSEDIFKSTKKFLEKPNTKWDSSQLSHLKLKPKFPTVRQFQRNNTTFSRLRFL